MWATSGPVWPKSAPRAWVRAGNIVLTHALFAPFAPRVYAYSVIPGGARSRQELTDAIARDRVVAAHYRAVSLGAVRSEKVKEDRFAYMSYRLGNKIYWTKNKLRLSQGETILTDGVTQIRARCGNCISMQPMGPTAETQPDTKQFDALGLAAEVNVPPTAPMDTGIGAGTIISTGLTSMSAELTPDLGASLGTGPFGNATAPPSVGGGFTSGTPNLPPGGSVGSSGSETASVLPLQPAGPPNTVPPEGGPPGSPEGGPTNGGFNPPGSPPPPTNTVPPVILSQIPPPTGGSTTPETPPAAPVPEPGTLLLVGGGLATLLSRRRDSQTS